MKIIKATRHQSPIKLAIQGPAGSGKSTVAKKVAEALGIPYIDTGAMYRALTYSAIKNNIEWDDDEGLIVLASKTEVELKKSIEGELQVFVDGENVTQQIRTPELTKEVHHIAASPGIRQVMAAMQRVLADKEGGVLEGRDIGTVVFPETRYKFFLDADFKVRVDRRFEQLKSKGADISWDELARDQKQRDERDRTRKIAPLKQAEDALVIDTTPLTINQVVGKITSSIQQDGTSCS